MGVKAISAKDMMTGRGLKSTKLYGPCVHTKQADKKKMTTCMTKSAQSKGNLVEHPPQPHKLQQCPASATLSFHHSPIVSPDMSCTSRARKRRTWSVYLPIPNDTAAPDIATAVSMFGMLYGFGIFSLIVVKMCSSFSASNSSFLAA